MDFSVFRQQLDVQRQAVEQQGNLATAYELTQYPTVDLTALDSAHGQVFHFVHQQMVGVGLVCDGFEADPPRMFKAVYTFQGRGRIMTTSGLRGDIAIVAVSEQGRATSKPCLLALDVSKCPHSSQVLLEGVNEKQKEWQESVTPMINSTLIDPMRLCKSPESVGLGDVTSLSDALPKSSIEEWLASIDTSNPDRYIRYKQGFQREYGSLEDIELEDNVEEALDTIGVMARGDRRRLIAAIRDLSQQNAQ